MEGGYLGERGGLFRVRDVADPRDHAGDHELFGGFAQFSIRLDYEHIGGSAIPRLVFGSADAGTQGVIFRLHRGAGPADDRVGGVVGLLQPRTRGALCGGDGDDHFCLGGAGVHDPGGLAAGWFKQPLGLSLFFCHGLADTPVGLGSWKRPLKHS